jgi:D-alanyl-D-alanine carboxypeptidase (penicillin-binding protein 5/6)
MEKSKQIKNIVGKIFINFIVLLVLIINLNYVEATNTNNAAKTEEVDISSRIALIYDRASGRILYEKNGNKQTPMASTTKIMTAIVVLENAKLTDTVTITTKAAGIGGSRLGLKKNDKITVNDLLYGLMLRSGNDAAVALAIHVGGSVEGFAEMMNKKAEELNLTNSHFVVPHGLDNEGHYTTAYELAKMADYALKIDKFKEIVGTKVATIHINGYAKKINNTNNLLGSVSGVYGVKTGFTNGAGRCLVTACKRNDLDIITVIIGADTNNIRSKDTIKLIQYAYTEFETIDIKEIIEEKFNNWKNINEGRIYVDKGIKKQVKLYLEELPYEKMAVKKDQIDKIDIEVTTMYYLEAPIKENEILGNTKIVMEEEVIEVLDIYVKEEIQKKNILDYLKEFLLCIDF